MSRWILALLSLALLGCEKEDTKEESPADIPAVSSQAQLGRWNQSAQPGDSFSYDTTDGKWRLRFGEFTETFQISAPSCHGFDNADVMQADHDLPYGSTIWFMYEVSALKILPNGLREVPVVWANIMRPDCMTVITNTYEVVIPEK